MWKLLFIFPLGLTKALSQIYYGSTTNNNSIRKIISTNSNKISSNSPEKVFRNIHKKCPVLKSLFNKVSGLQPATLSKKRLRHRFCPIKLLRIRFFIKHPPNDHLLEEHKILLKTVPVAIPRIQRIQRILHGCKIEIKTHDKY